jgi:hypothetical protein
VRDRGAWDDTFVDALCEPPATFTVGGTFAHVVTFNAFRRIDGSLRAAAGECTGRRHGP